MSTTSISDNCTLYSFSKTLLTSVYHFTFSKLRDLTCGLFGKNSTILKSEQAWHQNLALMQEAQNKTDDSSLKNRIRFLAVNYLNKIAPPMPSTARILGWAFFESAFQVSPYSPYQYHRAFFRYRPDISSSVNQRFALGNKSPLILTDTIEFDHFFSIKFTVLNRDNRKKWCSLILKAVKEKRTDLLFDFTQYFGDTILTEYDSDKEKAFCDHFNKLKNRVNHMIDSMDDAISVREFLKQKSTAISRVTFECNGTPIGGMKVLPLFTNLSLKNVIKTHPTLAHAFVEETGIVLGALNLRRLVPEIFPLPNHVTDAKDDFSVPYNDKEAFLEAIEQIMFENTDKPHVDVLGKSFLKMLRGLFSKIDTDKWDDINQHPATQEILHTVLHHIVSHLNNATASIEVDDNKFIQFIELAHAELATLLELTTPYTPEQFEEIYTSQLTIIPEGLRIRGGLSKTAETVFAEVNVAIRSTTNSSPVCTWCDYFYFEHALLYEIVRSLKRS